jgi:hypothetical protein
VIKRGLYVLPGPPPITDRERVSLDCGCTVIVGLRTDTTPPEPAVACLRCGPDHLELMERFHLALTDSLVNPSARPLIDIVDELLEGAAA